MLIATHMKMRDWPKKKWIEEKKKALKIKVILKTLFKIFSF